jgi:hypothetical protein
MRFILPTTLALVVATCLGAWAAGFAPFPTAPVWLSYTEIVFCPENHTSATCPSPDLLGPSPRPLCPNGSTFKLCPPPAWGPLPKLYEGGNPRLFYSSPGPNDACDFVVDPPAMELSDEG